MNPDQFNASSPGRLVLVTLKEKRVVAGVEELIDVPSHAFVPDPLPPKLDWSALKAELFDVNAEAVLALGRVNGLHKRVGKGAELLRTLWMREAKMSSEVEGIETTAEEMVLAGAGRTLSVRSQGVESWNYVHALEHGVGSELPLCNRLICEMHDRLLRGVRGDETRPGRFRDTPVYIGDRTRGPERARFVPTPPGELLTGCMDRFERFVHTNTPEIPPLFSIALAHYQFETIHPFRDGNGRIGRVLISRSLVKERLLDHPAVYMSAYINDHKREYVDGLLRVSTEGDWAGWIGFILNAVLTQANDAILRSERLIELREGYLVRLQRKNAPARVLALVDRLFQMPAINAAEAEQLLGVSGPTVYSDIERLEEAGILREYTGKRRDRDWLADGILQVIQADRAEDLSYPAH